MKTRYFATLGAIILLMLPYVHLGAAEASLFGKCLKDYTGYPIFLPGCCFEGEIPAYYMLSQKLELNAGQSMLRRLNGEIPLPAHWFKNFFIPDLEVSWLDTTGFVKEQFCPVVFLLRYDNLNRLIFPVIGLKANIDIKLGIHPFTWWRTRFRTFGTRKINLFNVSSPTISGRFVASIFDENTPEYQKYSLGGSTPAGSYQLRRYDYEDIPGFRRNEFTDPVMWKLGGAIRFIPWSCSIFAVPIDMLCEGYLNISYAGEKGENPFRKERMHTCPAVGFFLDTHHFNIGLLFAMGIEEAYGDDYWSWYVHHFRMLVAHYTVVL